LPAKKYWPNPISFTGDGIARAGIILGWIGVAMVLLAVIALILFLAPLTATTIQHVETLVVPVQP
jgi:hypothetical protein